MKTILNTRRFRTGRFWATTLSVAGLLMLLTATVTAFSPRMAASGLPLLILGTFFSLFGLKLSSRWLAKPPAHVAIDAALKGMHSDTVLIHHYPPAEHLLITPHGIFPLIACTQPSDLTINGPTWARNEPRFQRVYKSLTQRGLGNPRRDAQRASAHISQLLRHQFGDTEITVMPIIVFTHPKTKLTVTAQADDLPVAYTDKRTPSLKSLVRHTTGKPLSTDDMAAIERALTKPRP
jgi:hypothetical protein